MNPRQFRLPNGNPHSLSAYIMRYKKQFFIHSLGGVLYNTVIVGGPILLGYIALLIYSPGITLICSIPIPFALLAAEAVRHPLYRVSLQSRKASSRVTSHLQRTINGTQILRLFGREDTERERLKDYCKEQVKWNLRNSLFQSGMLPVYTTIASIGVFGILYWGGQKVTSGEWSVGYFTSFLAMFMAMTGRTQKAADVMNKFHAAKASWDRIKEKITADRSRENRNDDESANNSDRRLIVKELHFKYPNAAENTVKNISFGANQGDFIAITGSVGCGKSALAAALTGLYSYSGSVVIHGKELKNYNADTRVQTIGYSGQDMFLFSSTIAENITLKPKEQILLDERLQKAIYVSALVDDLPLFPDGLETIVGEKGVRISGGQRQRISLARAIYTQCPILILDDPFSAVDIGTEHRMIERLRQELTDTTILLFSHRLSAFVQADRIIVLDKGEIAEHGTHQELVYQKGIYEMIYTAQHWMESEEAGIA
ncbi:MULTISPECIES: ABC transporter ATP-binding protein [unclassified Paenibacillus]|uniref:ABC transporter ATP-binding protein n=1 Tax=unclassified Paenibacillus TaxID=185978 RepID=UPI0036446F4F